MIFMKRIQDQIAKLKESVFEIVNQKINAKFVRKTEKKNWKNLEENEWMEIDWMGSI